MVVDEVEEEDEEEVRLVDVNDTARNIKSGAIASTERRKVISVRQPNALK